jgi:hypothetical protein
MWTQGHKTSTTFHSVLVLKLDQLMHGCMVVHQTRRSAANRRGRLRAHPDHLQGLSPPPSLKVGTLDVPLKLLAPASAGGKERSHENFHKTLPKNWLLSVLQVQDHSLFAPWRHNVMVCGRPVVVPFYKIICCALFALLYVFEASSI